MAFPMLTGALLRPVTRKLLTCAQGMLRSLFTGRRDGFWDGHERDGLGLWHAKEECCLGFGTFLCGRAVGDRRSDPVVDDCWKPHPAFFDLELIRASGVIRILLGVAGIVDSFARFALQGLGTPAPVAPPQHLVVTGLYRYVQNPMYVAVITLVIGQAFLFGNWHLMVYSALFWLAVHVFVVAYEEPVLLRAFGAE